MTTVLNVEGMSCEHCVRHVTNALEDVAGVEKVAVNLEAKTATVDHTESATTEMMKAAVEEAGYTIV